MQFKGTFIIIYALMGLLSCAPRKNRKINIEQTSEKIDTTVSDTTISISIEEPVFSNPDYDPSKDPENIEMYNIFRPYVKEELLNVEQVSGTEDNIQCFVNYIGFISDIELQTEFHVVTEFCKIKTADSYRGNSKVAFVNEKLKYARVYYLKDPKELPISIEKNSLLFNFKGTKKGLQFKGGLPDMLCIPDGGCYE
ncbi:MAG: hypothetical protein IPM74_03815 [Crocinitomicaceae bacterium]|nr:hypothetical protein [Crocinitomicaceae bacterium]